MNDTKTAIKKLSVIAADIDHIHTSVYVTWCRAIGREPVATTKWAGEYYTPEIALNHIRSQLTHIRRMRAQIHDIEHKDYSVIIAQLEKAVKIMGSTNDYADTLFDELLSDNGPSTSK